MSLDAVDDLHAAEDHAEVLRGHALRVISLWNQHLRGQVSHREVQVSVDQLNRSTEPFVRPSCRAAWEDGEPCEDDCGGFHPWAIEQDDEPVEGPLTGHQEMLERYGLDAE